MPKAKKRKINHHFILDFFWFLLPIIVVLSIYYFIPYFTKIKLESKAKKSTMYQVKTVFLIILANRNLKEVVKEGRYIESLLRGSAYAQNYYIGADDLIEQSMRFTNLLEKKGVDWRIYEEGRAQASSGSVPYENLTRDLLEGKTARFNLIRPDKCHSMISCPISKGDHWLAGQIPKIINTPVYRDAGAIIITFASGSKDKPGQPLLFLVISPYAKNGPHEKRYTHTSLIKSLQEIFGATKPWLGEAANATDLSGLFVVK